MDPRQTIQPTVKNMTAIQYLEHEDGTKYDIKKDGIRKPLWYHKKNLMQTATGYGSKITTEYVVKYRNRKYRVYCHQYSNVGSLYIISKGKKIYIW